MRFFDKRHIYYGNLEFQRQPIGGCRCEVLSNEIDPEAWKATVSVFDGSHVALHKAMGSHDELLFKAETQQEALVIKPMFLSYTSSSSDDEVLKFRIKQLVRTRRYSTESISKVNLSYFIPIADLYSRRSGIAKHYKKGLLSGWTGWRREFGDLNVSSEWEDEVFQVPSDYGTLSFVPIMVFQETPIEDREATVAVDQMVVEGSFEGDNLSFERCKESVDGLIADYLYILSFIEGDFVEWYLCRGNCQTKDEKPVTEFENFKPIRIKKKSKVNEYHFSAHREGLQKAHIDLTHAYARRTEEEKIRIQRAIDRFIVASRVDAVDTELIYWHSCLDVLWKEVGGEGRSFSHKIVDACKKVKVEWRDIYPEITEASLEEKAEFPINRIRNAMLHAGEYPKDYTEVFEEIPKTKALCERLITRMLGIDHEGTGLGIVRLR